jgi:hypothetical protein
VGQEYIRRVYSQRIFAQDLGLFREPSGRGLGDFRGRGGQGAFSTIGGGFSGRFAVPPGIPVPSAPYCRLLLRLKVRLPGVVPRFAG